MIQKPTNILTLYKTGVFLCVNMRRHERMWEFCVCVHCSNKAGLGWINTTIIITHWAFSSLYFSIFSSSSPSSLLPCLLPSYVVPFPLVSLCSPSLLLLFVLLLFFPHFLPLPLLHPSLLPPPCPPASPSKETVEQQQGQNLHLDISVSCSSGGGDGWRVAGAAAVPWVSAVITGRDGYSLATSSLWLVARTAGTEREKGERQKNRSKKNTSGGESRVGAGWRNRTVIVK